MVNDVKILDEIHLQKYIYLITAFLKNKIGVSVFISYFLHLRREDTYWMNSLFDANINSIMDAIFLDVDEYNPDDLYNPDDKFNINESELRKRIEDRLNELNRIISRSIKG